MEVTIENLTKKFGDVVGIENLNLDIQDGEFVAFLGPSGCGKTTTLLMLAGIYKPTAGVIRFGNRVVNQISPKDRNIGMVFQSYALYPHMTVFGNIGYPLKLKKMSKEEQQQRVQRIADMMGIGHLLERRPGELSGGQQQRVALGRALVKEPDILLFDEPLSNLDARLRLTMRGEIKRLQKSLGITSIYVTHDQVEAMTMADRIAVISDGHLQAFDTPDDLFHRPRTLFIAGFVGNPPMNFVSVTIRHENGVYHAVTEDGALVMEVPLNRAEKVLASGKEQITMGIRPQDVRLDLKASSPVKGEVYSIEPLGDNDLINVHVGAQSLFLLANPENRMSLDDTVHVNFKAQNVQFFDPDTGHSLLWTQVGREAIIRKQLSELT